MSSLLKEDSGFFDITTLGLGIGERLGKMSFFTKDEIVLCGVGEAQKICNECGLGTKVFKKDGMKLHKGDLILECSGSADALHKAWKISQNIMEYLSGIATLTHRMVKAAKEINSHIEIATTRKNFPGCKESMLKAVITGGGVPHRLGLYDSVLVFKQHLAFFRDQKELEAGFSSLKQRFLEKKITVEVDSLKEASYFASLGADILQCEKMGLDELKECVELKKSYPHLLLSATGGVNEKNVQGFAKTGVDFIVTSAPYYAKPTDVKVVMEAME